MSFHFSYRFRTSFGSLSRRLAARLCSRTSHILKINYTMFDITGLAARETSLARGPSTLKEKYKPSFASPAKYPPTTNVSGRVTLSDNAFHDNSKETRNLGVSPDVARAIPHLRERSLLSAAPARRLLRVAKGELLSVWNELRTLLYS